MYHLPGGPWRAGAVKRNRHENPISQIARIGGEMQPRFSQILKKTLVCARVCVVFVCVYVSLSVLHFCRNRCCSTNLKPFHPTELVAHLFSAHLFHPTELLYFFQPHPYFFHPTELLLLFSAHLFHPTELAAHLFLAAVNSPCVSYTKMLNTRWLLM